MLNELIRAVRERKLISFTYSGLPREAQPTAVGVSRAGNNVLRCYQTKGAHVESGHEWDFCEVAKISDLVVLEGTFEADPPGYKRGDKHMSPIYAEL